MGKASYNRRASEGEPEMYKFVIQVVERARLSEESTLPWPVWMLYGVTPGKSIL